MNFNQLTIVVVSKNRHRFLLRQVNFWENMGCKMVILDGSDSRLPSSNLLNKINIEYLHVQSSVEHRLFIAGNYVKTKYVMLMGDDDMFVPSSVFECIHELNVDPMVIAVAGTVQGFDYSNSRVNFFDVYPNFLKNGQLIDASGWTRIKKHQKNYDATTVYSIFRTDYWLKIVDNFKDQSEMSGNLAEIIIEYCAAYLGKTKVINKVYWLRSFENQSQSRSIHPVGQWLLGVNNKERRSMFSRLRINLFSDQGWFLKRIYALRFYVFLTRNQLETEARRFRISRNFKWFLLLFMFLSSNIPFLSKLLQYFIKVCSNYSKKTHINKLKIKKNLPTESPTILFCDPETKISQKDYNRISNSLSKFYS